MSDEKSLEPGMGGNQEKALSELDDLLTDLPLEQPPAALVERTLAAVGREQAAPSGQTGDSATDTAGTQRRTPWRLIAAVLLGAVFLASMAVVEYGAKVRGLFETADSEVDTVESDL